MPILTDGQVKEIKRGILGLPFARWDDLDALFTHYEATIEDLKSQLPQKVELPEDVWNEIDFFRFNYEPEKWKWLYLDSLVNNGNSTRNSRTIDFNLIALAISQLEPESKPTVEDQLRTLWTPKIEAIVRDYHGDAAPLLTRIIIDSIMPLTREVLKAVEAEEGK